MLEVQPFIPEHILAVQPQVAQIGEYPGEITVEVGRSLAAHFAITGKVDGKVVGCCGIAELWTHRALAWALLSSGCGRHMPGITKIVRQALDLHPANRIEATVFTDFPAGRRWAELLGFHCETPEPMRHFSADGRSAWLYARIKEGAPFLPSH